jgi:hypothetical protein
MLPLPVPERGGSIEALRPFLNVSNENGFVLIVAWLLAALRPTGPYPLLAICGEQGSARVATGGRKIPAPSPAICVARRRFFDRWV